MSLHRYRDALVLIVVLFAGMCVTLMAMPNIDIPCKVTVNYKIVRFVPASKHRLAGEIKQIDRSKDLAGTGRMNGARFVCEVSINGQS